MFPRFQSIATLVGSVQKLSRNSMEFVSQLNTFANTNNLLSNPVFKKQAQEDLLCLRQEGWLSEKEEQTLSRLLSI
jgi:hypothetical protein